MKRINFKLNYINEQHDDLAFTQIIFKFLLHCCIQVEICLDLPRLGTGPVEKSSLKYPFRFRIHPRNLPSFYWEKKIVGKIYISSRFPLTNFFQIRYKTVGSGLDNLAWNTNRFRI